MTYGAGALSIGVIAATAASAEAFAHPGGDIGDGFLHPFLGIQHVLAMLAVGLWAGLVRGQAQVLAPAMFVIAAVAGALLAAGGVEVPGVATVVSISVVVFGLMAVTALRIAPEAGAALVGVFALFHGAAHRGEELAGSVLLFVLGFAAATALIQLSGIGLSGLSRRLGTELPARGLGAAATITGLVYLLS